MSCSTTAGSTCFNGAAVRRRRREQPRCGHERRKRRASTEPPSEDGGEVPVAEFAPRVPRRFNGAAVRRRRRDATEGDSQLSFARASTEPPSEDGGECWRTSIRRIVLAWLQRSRRPKTAESRLVAGAGGWGKSPLQRSRRPKTAESARRLRAHPTGAGRFNGAAVRRRRRGPRPSTDRHLVVAASTEPPSEDGGESRARPRAWRGASARSFNGAAVRRRRRGELGGHVLAMRSRRFNGAAVRRRRREAGACVHCGAALPLQRSRRPKTAESARARCP